MALAEGSGDWLKSHPVVTLTNQAQDGTEVAIAGITNKDITPHHGRVSSSVLGIGAIRADSFTTIHPAPSS